MAATSFNAILDRLADDDDVRGAILLNPNGVCLGTRGELTSSVAALILATVYRSTHAAREEDEATLDLSISDRVQAPTLAIRHGHDGMLLIRSSDKLTLGVLKSAPDAETHDVFAGSPSTPRPASGRFN